MLPGLRRKKNNSTYKEKEAHDKEHCRMYKMAGGDK